MTELWKRGALSNPRWSTGVLDSPAGVTPAGHAVDPHVGVQGIGDHSTLRCRTIAAQIEPLVGTLTPIDPH